MMHAPPKLLAVFILSGLALITSTLYTVAVMAEESSTPTLKEQLEATNAATATRLPPPVLQNIEAAIQEVADSGIVENAKQVGDRAPDFALPDAAGNMVSLSTLLKEGPVILTWYRGNW